MPYAAIKYPPTDSKPVEFRDFSRGRITKYSVNNKLIPINSVSECQNVNFDTIIGSGVVRPGTTLLGSTVASNKTPLGLSTFVSSGGSTNIAISVFSGASTATLYYYDTTWHASSLTSLSNSVKNRFAQIGNRVFKVNGTDAMLSSSDGNTWTTTNCIPAGISTGGNTWASVNPKMILRTKQRLIATGDANNRDRIFLSSVINTQTVANTATITYANPYATVTVTAHGYSAGDTILISGATQTQYNGVWRVVDTTTDTFRYFIGGTITSPATGTITATFSQLQWNTNTQTGDWIDVNPDDGGNITALAETSNQVVVFKNTGMYRFDVVNKTVDSQSIFNLGSVSQEATTSCQGIVYFFSGIDIRRTDGGYPEQISRLGVQDFIDAIPQSSWSSVSAGNDGLNVYFSIGNITLNSNRNNQQSYTNVILKFSTRDETWSVHSYKQSYNFFTLFTTSADGLKMIGSDTSGNVQTINKGTTDNGSPIFYNLETQELEFGNRAHINSMSDLIAVFCNNGAGSSVQIKPDADDFIDVEDTLPKRVNIIDNFNAEGNYFTLKWFGSTTLESPVFEGFYIERIKDEGMVND